MNLIKNSFLLEGCLLVNLIKEQKELEESFFLTGKVTTETSSKGHIVIIVYTEDKMIYDYTILAFPRSYLFYVPDGEYYLVAFEDANDNLIYDRGERTGQYGSPDKIETSSSQVIRKLDISISDTGHTPPDFLEEVAILKFREDKHIPGFGTVVNLDDEIFAGSYGRDGILEPSSFMKEVIGGVFFLEEYDRKKIPILFIHGSGGTPRQWDFFIDSIDRKKYQPWVFYYPSGAYPLERLVNYLNFQIKELHARYQFREIYVTAFSMGGLIARSFILQNYNENAKENSEDYITLFVSISTPWGGVRSAKFGAESAPVKVPTWPDLALGSKFLEDIFEDPLPPRVKYHLFFGYKKGVRIPLRANNDGTITMESALDWKAQSEAEKVYGFNENHPSILFSKDVATKYNEILSSLH